jgi:hypothetical protein
MSKQAGALQQQLDRGVQVQGRAGALQQAVGQTAVSEGSGLHIR